MTYNKINYLEMLEGVPKGIKVFERGHAINWLEFFTQNYIKRLTSLFVPYK